MVERLARIESTMVRLEELFKNYQLFLFDLEEGRTFYLSPNMEAILGVSNLDLARKRVRPLADLCHPDDWSELIRHLARMRGLADGPTHCIAYRLQISRTSDYHHCISFQKNVGTLFDHRDTLLGISADYSDYLQREWHSNCHFRDRMKMILETIRMSIQTRYDLEQFRASA